MTKNQEKNVQTILVAFKRRLDEYLLDGSNGNLSCLENFLEEMIKAIRIVKQNRNEELSIKDKNESGN